ncbi:hypothetical protein FNF27_00677 [Cafeteria roenbergensis]|uniref:AN1-type domain-containing protein n=1 Tax=Cafeteria roenbergensis TaxID=33653 RepID=A0A5A8EKH0_CAFRO|nr:hypothetical protein FNF27_00677 [Cafeteria roenbergensis]
MDIGEHCSHPSCGRRDFLPFKCDACDNTFCLEHRSYDAHECAKAAGHDRKVIACPVCLQRVPLVTGEDVNVTFERHMASSGCNPERRSAQGRRKPKATCPAPGCRATMGPSNTFRGQAVRRSAQGYHSQARCAGARRFGEQSASHGSSAHGSG